MEADPEVKLCLAANDGNKSEVRFLVETGVNINSKSSGGLTPLLIASIRDELEIVSYLVKQGADVNKPCSCGVSPLMAACGTGNTQVAKFLLQCGADVNAVNHWNETVLLFMGKGAMMLRVPGSEFSRHLSATQCHLGCRCCAPYIGKNTCDILQRVRMLVEAGADVNHETGTDDQISTPLKAFVSILRNSEICKFLLECGADPNHRGKGNTALEMAFHRLDIMKLLLSYGADVNLAGIDGGNTPLMSVARAQTVDVIKFLLEAGADLNASNFKGYTALTFAVKHRNSSVVKYLIKAGAKMDRELILTVLQFNCEKEYLQMLVTNGALPKQNWNIPDLLADVKHYNQRMKLYSQSFLLEHPVLKHLKNPVNEKFTPFSVSLMKNTLCVTRYLVKILFLSPVDVELLNHYMQRPSDVENDGISCHLLPLVTQPWSLFNLSFLAVSFAVGFNEDREERVSKTGLPSLLQRKFLFQDEDAHLPVKEWGKLTLAL